MADVVTVEMVERQISQACKVLGLDQGQWYLSSQNGLYLCQCRSGATIGYIDRGTKREVLGQMVAIVDGVSAAELFGARGGIGGKGV